MIFHHFSINQKLNLAFTLVWSFMVVLLALSYMQLEDTLKNQKTAQETSHSIALTAEWQQQTELHLSHSIAFLMAPDASETRKHFATSIKNTANRISVITKDLQTSLTSLTDKNLLNTITERHQAYMAQHGDVLKLSGASASDEAIKSKLLPVAQSYIAALEQWQKNQKESLAEESGSYSTKIHTAQWVMLSLVVFGIGLGAFLIRSVTRSIQGPLQQAIQTTKAIASGDLSTPIETSSRDDIGKLLSSLGSMQQSLRQLVGNIRQSTDHISTASVQIASGNQDLGHRTEQTASNLQQATSSMDQLTNNVKQSADNARQANQLASSAAEVAARGGQVVSQVVSTMDEINTSSKKISDIIGVIDGIAFQTNILALNAAVEAARAGEQGRGFAVVASEVRSLAGRSAEAAKEIKSLIGASVERVEIGSRLVEDAGSTMKEIVTSVQRVSDIISEISAAASEQSSGISQVNTSVVQLDQMTQQNAALVEEGSAAAESLRDQAKRLAQLLGTFNLGGHLLHEPKTPSQVAYKGEDSSMPIAPHPSAAPKPATAAKATPRRSQATAIQGKNRPPMRASAPPPLTPSAHIEKQTAPSPAPTAVKMSDQAISKPTSSPVPASPGPVSQTSNDGDWEHF